MKRILSIALVLTLLVAIGAVAVASESSIKWTDGFGFHCNAGKGNGKVTTGAEKAVVDLVRVGNTTTWNLNTINIVCPLCERIDWVTFSNNNGKINGKNIQVNHSDNPVFRAEASAQLVLIDIVKDCEGNIVGEKEVVKELKSGVFPTNAPAVFDFEISEGYDIIKGTNPVIFNFEAKAGQKLSGKVVALKVTVLECECEEEDDEKDPGFFDGGNIVCSPCQNGGGNNHSNCFAKKDADHPQFILFCACPCNIR